MNKTRAIMMLGESEWEISFSIGDFESEQAAQNALNTSEAMLAVDKNTNSSCIVVYGDVFDAGKELRLYSQDVTIREISPEVRGRLGPPIDITLPGGVKKVIAVLMSRDPAYTIEEKDMIPSKKTLDDFVARYGDGYVLDHIADGLETI